MSILSTLEKLVYHTILFSLISCSSDPKFNERFSVEAIPTVKLLSERVITKSSNVIKIAWIAPAKSQIGKIQRLIGYSIRIEDSLTGLLLHEEQITRFLQEVTEVYDLPINLPEGVYKVYITVNDSLGGQSTPSVSTVLVASTKPKVTLTLGSERVSDACATPVPGREAVAARLTQFNFCVEEKSKVSVGVNALCIKRKGDPSPLENDPCWKKPNELYPLILLENGSNDLVLYARDEAGNMGDGNDQINLQVGQPPNIDILAPISSAIAQSKWNVGDEKIIRWKINSPNPMENDFKVIVTLVDASDGTKFQHMACSFKNSLVWQQCPYKSLEGSSAFTMSGNGIGEFNYLVPAGWGSDRYYMVVITAIDSAGNAAVASTGEINSSAEVLAGRSYAGLGGSGLTISRSTQGRSELAMDRRGQLYVLTDNFKLNAFDDRSCRFVKTPKDLGGPFDCNDILTTDVPIRSGPWVYNLNKDVFYNAQPSAIYEIDFNKGTVNPVFGKGATELTDTLPANAKSEDYKGVIYRQLAFDSVGNRLFFRTADQLFSIDGRNHLTYVLGKAGSAALNPADQPGTRQRDISLPLADAPFAVTKDQRILFGSTKLPNAPNGGSNGLQFILDDFSLADTNHVTNFLVTAPNQGAWPAPAGEYVSRLNQSRYHSVIDLAYDPEDDQFFSSLGFVGFYRMKLPPKGTPATSYRWEVLVLRDVSKLEKDLLVGGGIEAPLPIGMDLLNDKIVYAGSDRLLGVNAASGSILAIDLSKNRVERVVGFGIGLEGDQLSINRRLDTPYSLFLDQSGDVVFNDYYHLHKISLSQAGGDNPSITTLGANFPRYPLVFDLANSKIIQPIENKVNIYSYPELVKTTQAVSTTNITPQYDMTFGVGNNYQHLRTFHYKAMYYEPDAVTKTTWLREFDFLTNTARFLTNPDLLGLGLKYCIDSKGATIPCPQSGLNGTDGQGAYYKGNEYRVSGFYGTVSARVAVGAAAFDATDSYVYTCTNSTFVKIDLAMKNIYPYTPYLPDGITKVKACIDRESIFKFTNGKLYYGAGDGVFEIEPEQIMIANKAVFRPLVVSGKMYRGKYGDFILSGGYIYYTEKTTHRVFRNALGVSTP